MSMFSKRKRSDCHFSMEDVATHFDQNRTIKRCRQVSPSNNHQNPWLSLSNSYEHDSNLSSASDTSSPANDYFPMMPIMTSMSCDSCGRGDNTMGGNDSMDVDMGSAATLVNTCAGCGRNTCVDCAMSCLGGQRCCSNCTESDSLPAIMDLARKMGTGWTGFTRDNRIYWRLS